MLTERKLIQILSVKDAAKMVQRAPRDSAAIANLSLALRRRYPVTFAESANLALDYARALRA